MQRITISSSGAESLAKLQEGTRERGSERLQEPSRRSSFQLAIVADGGERGILWQLFCCEEIQQPLLVGHGVTVTNCQSTRSLSAGHNGERPRSETEKPEWRARQHDPLAPAALARPTMRRCVACTCVIASILRHMLRIDQSSRGGVKPYRNGTPEEKKKIADAKAEKEAKSKPKRDLRDPEKVTKVVSGTALFERCAASHGQLVAVGASHGAGQGLHPSLVEPRSPHFRAPHVLGRAGRGH